MKHRISKWISAGLCLTILTAALSGCDSRPGSSEAGTNSPVSGQGLQADPGTSAGDDGGLLFGSMGEEGSSLSDLSGSGDDGVRSDLSPISHNDSAEAPSLSAADAEVYTDFAIRLFQESMDGTQNILVSPLSVINALAMTANGAKGETLTQMEDLFGADISSLSEYLRTLNQTLPDEENCKLHLANSIWYRDNQGFSVKEDFLKINTDFFHSEIYPSSFDSTALQEINRWVSDHTDGMIPQIIDQIEEDTVMYLINALAFDALWLAPYGESQIQADYFIPENWNTQSSDASPSPGIGVQMMHSQESVLLRDMDDQGRTAALGFLKYYSGGKYALATLLPGEGTGIEDYVNSLSGEKICRILAEASDAEINAALPIFETEYSVNMKDILTAMGMTAAFDPDTADLSGIGSYPGSRLYVDDVIHKTYISVDSSGTKAGAATAVVIMKETALLERNPIDITLNRPFVYMIVDCENMAPVFIGVLSEPVEICRLPPAEP